jgi:disulfide bond formation protein DsbB|mmetsp:Transcript_12096/g.31891  ORF Transcript_12096/g.31891 Transcript_12096/m.31891 type:complete len:91 (+) Transcript_12096:3676-3948(+)
MRPCCLNVRSCFLPAGAIILLRAESGGANGILSIQSYMLGLLALTSLGLVQCVRFLQRSLRPYSVLSKVPKFRFVLNTKSCSYASGLHPI